MVNNQEYFFLTQPVHLSLIQSHVRSAFKNKIEGLEYENVLLISDIFFSFVYSLAWTSFACCMAAAVTTINKYTKTILEFKHRRKKLERSFRIQYNFPDHTAPEKVCNVYVNSFQNTTDDPTHAIRSLRHLATISVL